MSTVILVENVSKQYRLGDIGTGSISHDINRFWYRVRGKEDPYLKIGETNDRTSKGTSDYVWSLKDINFKVEQGDAVGIIGRNGAGKSTLLKLLSRVTAPTTGSIKVKGRIASLLEVGTGFHPELTGRENVFLNGAILGMRKQEVKRKFDEIVAFAGVERYIDTPVKRYSSGMYVRLAFGVAAHLESEILIVDEVLAVGDAEFQRKCLGKMNDVSKGEGRTVLFVSHNMGAIRSFCRNGIYLKNGMIEATGSITDVMTTYINANINSENEHFVRFPKNTDAKHKIYLDNARIEAVGRTEGSDWNITDQIRCSIEYYVEEAVTLTVIDFRLKKEGETIFISFDTESTPELFRERKPGYYKAEFFLPDYLIPGQYTIDINIGRPGIEGVEHREDCLSFTLENLTEDGKLRGFTRGGIIRPQLNWYQ